MDLTLDPVNWDGFAELSHRMLDDMLTHLKTLRDRPAWTQSPSDIRQTIFSEPPPMTAQGERRFYEQFVKENVLQFGIGNGSPRFYGWVQGNGIPFAMMSDMLASGMNPHMAGFNQNPVLVEQRVVEWMRELMGFPTGSSGLLLSGGSMANFRSADGSEERQGGVRCSSRGASRSRAANLLRVGGGDHNWAQKALGTLGVGDGFVPARFQVKEDFSRWILHPLLRRRFGRIKRMDVRPDRGDRDGGDGERPARPTTWSGYRRFVRRHGLWFRDRRRSSGHWRLCRRD